MTNTCRFEEFVQTHCGLGNLTMTSKVVEMLGLLAYDFLMEVVMGALKHREDAAATKKGGQEQRMSTELLEPIHIASFLESKQKKIMLHY